MSVKSWTPTSKLVSSHPPSAPPPSAIMTEPVSVSGDHDPSISSFLSNPWTASLLSSPDYYPIRTWSRLQKVSTGEDGFFASTLATPTTIPHCITLRRKTVLSPPAEVPAWPSPTSKPTSDPKVHPPDVLMCVNFGEPGICGHPRTAHGGVVATLVDEAMSLAIALQPPAGMSLQRVVESGLETTAGGVHPRGHIYTSQLDVRFKRPVTAPGIAVVRAKVVARVGRKYWVRAQVVQEEEDDGDKKGTGEHLEWTKRKIVKADAMAFWLETVPPATSAARL